MFGSLLLRLGLASHIHRSGTDAGRNMRRIIFLDHLHARPAVLGDLVDIRAFHEPEADVGVA